MKAYIFHGDDTVESRKKLTDWIARARQKNWAVEKVAGESITTREVATSIKSDSLFSDKQLIVIENFILSNKDSFDFLKKLSQEMQKDYLKGDGRVVIFWERKGIDGRKLTSLKKYFLIEGFSLPFVLFNFLDALSPGNTKKALISLNQAKSSLPPEMLLVMTARQVRLLIWAKTDPKTLKLSPWQKQKLIKQAENFEEKDLYALHSKLLEIDRKQKTSTAAQNLPSTLDLLVAGI